MKIMLGRNIINILIFSFVLVVLFFQSAYISSLKGIYLVLVTFVVILPFLIFFKKKLPLLVISLFFSSLIIPGLTNRFNLFYIILITFLIFDFLRKPTFTSNDKKIEFILVSFVILLVLTITVRGIGIQFLGSKNIGGFAYIQILATILLILKFRTIHLSEKDWYKAIYVMCILGILPLVISLLVGTHIITINNPVVWFFQISGDTLAYLTESANISDVRINPAKSASIFILILILLKNSNIGKLDKQFYIGFLFSILIAGLSGFRSSTIILIGFTLIYFFLNNRYKYRFFYLSASALIFLILTMFLQDLPYTIQRAFAWIPFLDVSDQARKSAFGTNEWRIAVWYFF